MQKEGRGAERRLHERLAFVVRVDNRASIAYAAAPARSVRRAYRTPLTLRRRVARGVDAVVIVAVPRQSYKKIFGVRRAPST